MKPKKILIGAINDHSGNAFIRGLLDDHPSILMFSDYMCLNNNLFWVCVSLSMIKGKDILDVFWSTYGSIAAEAIDNKELFNEKMRQLLEREDSLTSQQLFVMFHIAYMYMQGKNITECDISEKIIYWEPHMFPREFVEDFAKWFEETGRNSCCILNLVRNRCMQICSRVKDFCVQKRKVNRNAALVQYSLDKKEYVGIERVVVRFEDLKCDPENTLLNFCDQLGIS